MKLIPYYKTTCQPTVRNVSPLSHELDEVFNAFFHGARGWTPRASGPVLEVEEDKDHYSVRLEVPGFRKEDLKIEVTGDVLTLSGEHKDEKRGDVQFSRSVQLPGDVQTDRVEAKHEYGVLTLTLPKREEVKPRSVEIKVS
jgi:HSP20 family protein